MALLFLGIIMHKLYLPLILTAALGFSATSAQAFFINANGSFNGDADIDDLGGAEVSTSVYRLMAGNQYFTFAYKHTAYDFSGIDDPFDSLNYLALDGRYEGKFDGTWGYFTGLTLAMGFEDDIHVSDNYAVTPRIGMSYQIAKGTDVFLGALAQFNDVDNVYLPIVGIKFGSEQDLGWSGSIAYPATRVTYRPFKSFAVESTLLTVREVYQLADDSDLMPEGYIFEESYGLSAGIIYTPLDLLELRAGVQSFFDREYTLYDAGGDEIKSYDVDPSVGGYFNVNFRF